MFFVRITTRKRTKSGLREFTKVLTNPTIQQLRKEFWDKFKHLNPVKSLNHTMMLDKKSYSHATMTVSSI